VAKVTMPQLGESVTEGTIGKWLKNVGDAVALDEPLLEVITDKVNAEVPSPYAGVLREILVEEGKTVPFATSFLRRGQHAPGVPRLQVQGARPRGMVKFPPNRGPVALRTEAGSRHEPRSRLVRS
jgi:2-oxoisovalerate dehydrogenase E2 component (dihydrolipoyl transacylase)